MKKERGLIRFPLIKDKFKFIGNRKFEVEEDYKVKNNIDFTTVTACGECCVGCKKKEDGICQGCIESDGHCVEWESSGLC